MRILVISVMITGTILLTSGCGSPEAPTPTPTSTSTPTATPHAETSEPAPAALTRITAASDANRDSEQPHLSADGTKLVFHSDSDVLGEGIPDNQFEIWRYDFTTEAFTRITTASAPDRDSFSPVISGDGSTVVFRSNNDFLNEGLPANQAELWRYDVASGEFIRLTTASEAGRTSSGPSLSADGSKIVFRSDSDFLGEGITDNQFEIWLYDATDESLTRLTTASDSERDSRDPHLRSDGAVVAFSSNSDFLNEGVLAYEIWLYDIAAGTYSRLTEASANDRASVMPVLSSDGSTVLFASDADLLKWGMPAGQFDIWLYDLPGDALTRLTQASDDQRASYNPVVSADGRVFAFVSNSDFLFENVSKGVTAIWLFDRETYTYTYLSPPSDSVRYSEHPTISADGARIAFDSDSDFYGVGIPREQYEIWVYER